MFDLGCEPHFEAVMRHLGGIGNLASTGRQGGFSFPDMHSAMGRGADAAADVLARGAGSDGSDGSDGSGRGSVASIERERRVGEHYRDAFARRVGAPGVIARVHGDRPDLTRHN